MSIKSTNPLASPQRVILYGADGNPISTLPISGTVAIDQTTDGSTNGVSVTNPTIEKTVGAAVGTLAIMAGGSDGTNVRHLKTDASGELQVDVLSNALPTGAATNAKLDEVKALLGEVQATPTDNTVLDRLKDLLTGIVLAAGSANIGDVDVLTLPGIVGSVADDGVSPGAPVMIGGKAVETDGTDPGSVSAEDDAAILRTDRNRRLLVNQNHPNSFTLFEDHTSAQSNNQLKAAPGAGLSIYITDLIISNGATAGYLNLVEDEGGTPVQKTQKKYVGINGGFVENYLTPLKLTANKSLGFTSNTVTTHSIEVHGYVAP